jgi:hypothetical protein
MAKLIIVQKICKLEFSNSFQYRWSRDGIFQYMFFFQFLMKGPIYIVKVITMPVGV